MPAVMSKCKITVVKRALYPDLAAQYYDGEKLAACEQFKDGQEFVAEQPFQMPEGFGCAWAWADIRNDVLLIASGGNLSWIKPRGTAIAGCTDWLRPVIFKIERID